MSWIAYNISFDLNILLLQYMYKATGIGHMFKNFDRPLPKHISIHIIPI